MASRLPNNINISIPNVPSEVLVKGLSDVIISGGSACTSGDIEPSQVVLALGNEWADCAIRISVGRFTTLADIKCAADKIVTAVKEIRS